MTGVAGFVAPRHLKAIKDTGNTLAAASASLQKGTWTGEVKLWDVAAMLVAFMGIVGIIGSPEILENEAKSGPGMDS